MLPQRLTQHGVATDLTQIAGEDIAAIVRGAEAAKIQAQQATVYKRAALGLLRQRVKIAKAQAELYKGAHEQLKELDGHRLAQYKAELGHEVHVAKVGAQADSERQLANAKKASATEVEQARLHGRLIKLGLQHRAALVAAKPRRKLFGFL